MLRLWNVTALNPYGSTGTAVNPMTALNQNGWTGTARNMTVYHWRKTLETLIAIPPNDFVNSAIGIERHNGANYSKYQLLGRDSLLDHSLRWCS